MDRVARVAVRVALAVVILGSWPGALEPFAPFKALFVRAIGLGLLVWMAAEAWAGRVERPRTLTWTVLAWVAMNAAATFTSHSPRLSFLGDLAQREGFLLALALAGLHVASAHAHRSEGQVRATLRAALLAGMVAALHAQLQLAGLDPLHWDGLRTTAVDGSIALRPTGPLGDTRLLAVVLAVALPLALARFTEERDGGAGFVPMLLLVPGTALLASALVTTLSRSAWLAAGAGAFVTLAFTLLAGSPIRRMSWAAAVSLLPALLFGFARSAGATVTRLAEGVGPDAWASRAVVASGAMQLWGENIWFGVGPDAFGLAYPGVQVTALWRDGWVLLPTHAPTVPLQVLATVGLLGAAAGLAWVLFTLRELVRAWRSAPEARGTLAGIAGALAVLGVASGTGVVGIAGAVLFAVLSALPLGLAERPAAAGGTRRTLHPSVAAGLALIVAAVELASGSRELRALTLARESRPTTQQGATPSEWRAQTQARAAAAWDAVTLWPNEAELWRIASEASLAAGDAGHEDSSFAAAELAARRAVELEPERAASHERLALVLVARATRTPRSESRPLADSAHAQFERATSLAPVDGRLLVAQIRSCIQLGDPVSAYVAAQRLVALYPEAAVSHALAGASLYLVGNEVEARAALTRAGAARWAEDESAQRLATERLLKRLETKPERRPPARRSRTRSAPRR